MRTLAYKVSVDEGICRCVGLKQEWALAFGAIPGRSVNSSTVMNRHGACRPAGVNGIFKIEKAKILTI